MNWRSFQWEHRWSLLNDLSHTCHIQWEFMRTIQHCSTHLVIDNLLGLDWSYWHLRVWTTWEASQCRFRRFQRLRIIQSFSDLRFGQCEFPFRYCTWHDAVSELIDGPLYRVDLLENTRIALSFEEWIRILFTNVNIQLLPILLCFLQCLRCKSSIFTLLFPEFCKVLLKVLSILFLEHFSWPLLTRRLLAFWQVVFFVPDL